MCRLFAHEFFSLTVADKIKLLHMFKYKQIVTVQSNLTPGISGARAHVAQEGS
jgi:hypothetical protein